MEKLNAHDISALLLSLGFLLAFARALGEIAQRWNQPAVLGELLAGILLGPTVFGALSPEWQSFFFPKAGARFVVMDGFNTVAIVLYLLVAGLEVDLSSIWRQGRIAIAVSLSGILIPFALGFGVAWFAPVWLGHEADKDLFIYALFFATALSISALPVIAKTLMDLNLFRTELGMCVIAAAIVNDLIGWIIFAIILGMMDVSMGHGSNIGLTIFLTLLFAAGTLSIGRWTVNRMIPWIQAHASFPGGVMGFSLALAFFGAAFTEWIGIHAVFGSFLIGVAIGDSRHLREHTRTVINQFISFIFAPLFFASIGLKVNFIAHFDFSLTLIVLVIACLGKVLGCGLGAQLAGMEKRQAWAVGFAMNVRGAMEIILGLMALQYGVISERMFVSLVIMALVTSLIGGPAIQRILKRTKPRKLLDFLKAKAFLPSLHAENRWEAIRELAVATGGVIGIDAAKIQAAVIEREESVPTGLENGVAIPHARIEGLAAPVVGMGISPSGVDFDAPDGRPSHLVFMILTPLEDDGAQLELLADVAKTFRNPMLREKSLAVENYIEMLALLNTEQTKHV